MSLVATVAVGAAAVGCAGLARAVHPPTIRLASRVRPYNHAGRSGLGLAPDVGEVAGADLVSRFVEPIVGRWLRSISHRIEPRDDTELTTALHRAGRSDLTAETYRVRQVARGAIGAAAFAAFALLVFRRPAVVVAFCVIGFIWGSARVRAEIDRAVDRRVELARLELATVAQLLALHIRTGAGLVQAVQRFSERGRGVLADELRSVVASVRAGSRETDAFRRAAELTAAPEVARMHLLFANGVERGADLATALLAIADDLRDARRDDVKRRAIRSRAAMLLPTIGVLAPVMLLFIAAPLPSIVFGNR